MKVETEILNQLKEVFSALENRYEFSYAPCDHVDQASLIQMLDDLQKTSPLVSFSESKVLGKVHYPQFDILKNNEPTRIHFKGIPGGHEFTSLVLAILHLDGQGRLFDEEIKNEVLSLRGPIQLQTYVSLSCENCPEVVQALNQMSAIHPEFSHTMVDGAYVQDEIDTLGIQGVPSIVANGKLLHSGKIGTLDLIQLLAKAFGRNELKRDSRDFGMVDVAVLGGGPAGASAAIYLARKGLKTALIAEKIGGQVNETKGIENLISTISTDGPTLAGQLTEHLRAYPVQILEHRRVKQITTGQTKQIEFENGDQIQANSVIVATGARWRELGVPGEKEYIGRGVAFCPHCDGPFYKGKKVAVIGGGNSGVEAAIDLAGIVQEVVLIEYGEQLKADQVLVERLKSLKNASIMTSAKTKQIVGDGSKVNRLIYEDRLTSKENEIVLDGVFIQIGLLPNSQFLKGVVELNKMGEIIVDEKGRTSVPGIYAAGDVTNIPFKQIVIAMGEGAKVALSVFEDGLRQGAHENVRAG